VIERGHALAGRGLQVGDGAVVHEGISRPHGHDAPHLMPALHHQTGSLGRRKQLNGAAYHLLAGRHVELAALDDRGGPHRIERGGQRVEGAGAQGRGHHRIALASAVILYRDALVDVDLQIHVGPMPLHLQGIVTRRVERIAVGAQDIEHAHFLFGLGSCAASCNDCQNQELGD